MYQLGTVEKWTESVRDNELNKKKTCCERTREGKEASVYYRD